MNINQKLIRAAEFNPTEKSHKLTVLSMCQQIEKQQITLPLYQRDMSWNLHKCISLLNYQLLGKAPVSPLSVNAINDLQDYVPQVSFITREIVKDMSRTQISIVDGQQRLTTNYKAYTDSEDFRNIVLDLIKGRFLLVEGAIERYQIPVGKLLNKEDSVFYSYVMNSKYLRKENVLPVLCRGAMMSKEDIEGALEQLKDSNHVVLSVNPLDVEAFHFNHKDRCYHCKRSIMSKVIAVAKEHDFAYVLDGKNKDDEKVYRPGLKACEELGIISPLANNDLAKQEIRDYSKQLGIVTYNKPSNACLASRFDYNTELTLEKLKLVETGEKYLHDLGMLHVRLRVHGDVARLEVEPQDFMKIIENKELIQNIKNLGFRFVTLDLEGIRSGGYDIENTRNSTKG